MIRVGVIGSGTVGGAHAAVFRHYCDVRVHDIDPDRATHTFEEAADSDVVFVCVPTPMKRTGEVDSEPTTEVVLRLAGMNQARAVVLKSTLPPSDLIRLWGALPARLWFSPEFLTDRSAEYDLQQSTRFIFGGREDQIRGGDAVLADSRAALANLFAMRFPLVPLIWTSLEAASLAKYMTNVFFATKVALLNELAAVAEVMGVDPSHAIDLMMMDPRIGRSHFQVPGHDGRPGFGGACFLKDMAGFYRMACDFGHTPKIVQAAWHTNLERRGALHVAAELNRLEGRAVSEKVTRIDLETLCS